MICSSQNSLPPPTQDLLAGPGGWTETQRSDATLVVRSPSGRIYTARPGGSLFFPQPPPAPCLPDGPAPHNAAKTLAMPTRPRTRAAERARRVQSERAINRARILADPPPF